MKNNSIYLKQSILLVFLCLLLSFFAPALFAKEKSIDVALVLDASGSMKKNDPNRLRIEAAKMFVSLLNRKDRVSVVSFGSRAYPVTGLLPLDKEKNEITLMRGIEKMVSNRKFTNLHDALSQGYDVLKQKKKDKREKHIILMSDGQMDLGNQARNLRLLEKTLDELTPKFAAENIKVHTIAFTRDSYIPLLKLAAEDTNGQFVILDNPKNIHSVFENLFVRSKEPEELPLKEDSFIVDENVKELTIVASKYKPGSVISLESPTAEEISKGTHSDNVKWFSARQFDLITINKPAPGYWLIKFSEGGNKAYILSDFSLHVDTSKKTAEPGTPFHVRAYLSKRGKIIKNKNLLRSTSFNVKVIAPSGDVLNNRMIDDGSEIGSERFDGIYGISYAFDNEGAYKIEIEVNSETFDRKKTLFIDVKSFAPAKPFATVVDAAKEEAEKAKLEAEAKAKAEAELAKSKSEEIENNKNESAASTDKDMESKADADAMLDSEKLAEAEAATEAELTDEAAQAESDAESLHAEEGGYSLFEAVTFFILFNLLLVGGGAGYYFYYRKKLREKDKDTEQSGPIDKPDAFKDEGVDLSTEDDGFAEMEDEHSAPDLDKEESIPADDDGVLTADDDSNAEDTTEEDDEEGSDGELSDIDLEAELSSILDSEDNINPEKDSG